MAAIFILKNQSLSSYWSLAIITIEIYSKRS